MPTFAIVGQRHHGKTQFGVLLALGLKLACKIPLYSNDPKLVGMGLAIRETKDTLLAELPAIHFDDELWRHLDSWGFKDQFERKKIKIVNDIWQLQSHNDEIFIYTTQMHSAMTNRIRDTADYIINCYKKYTDNNVIFTFDVINGYTKFLMKRIIKTIDEMKFIYDYYDHKGHVLPILGL